MPRKMKPFRVTFSEVREIKSRIKAGETGTSILKDYRRFSHSTVCAIGRGVYDHIAVAGESDKLTDRDITRLLAFPTPEQAYANHEIQPTRYSFPRMFWMP